MQLSSSQKFLPPATLARFKRSRSSISPWIWFIKLFPDTPFSVLGQPPAPIQTSHCQGRSLNCYLVLFSQQVHNQKCVGWTDLLSLECKGIQKLALTYLSSLIYVTFLHKLFTPAKLDKSCSLYQECHFFFMFFMSVSYQCAHFWKVALILPGAMASSPLSSPPSPQVFPT